MKLVMLEYMFKCHECKHVGVAAAYEDTNYYPSGDRQGAETTIEDVHCTECGSYDVEEI